MNLIQEIQLDILNQSTSLSTILRKAKVLAYRLKNKDFKEWVDNELDSYYGKSNLLPGYRTGITHSIGHFAGPFSSQMKNTPIPTLNLPEHIQSYANDLTLFDGVRGLESLLESDKTTFRIDWPPNLVAAISDEIFDGWTCVSAWQVVPRSIVEQTLNDIRNRLLNFVLELEEIQPDIGELSPSEKPKISDEKVEQVFQTFIGGRNIVNPSAVSTQGDFYMSDTFNMSGDFRNSIINIKSILVDTRQSIETIHERKSSIKEELNQLVDQLEEELQKVPAEHEEDAEAVAESAKRLIEEASKEKSNGTLLTISAEGLQAAAKNIAKVMPTILTIASQIVNTVLKLSS